MRNKITIAAFGLALLCASQSWAGTSGNGWSQRGGPQPAAVVHYIFCYGGNRKAIYFSSVFATAPSVTAPSLTNVYADYLTQQGYANDGGQCITAGVRADAVAEKSRRETMFPRRQIVETDWTGGSASAPD